MSDLATQIRDHFDAIVEPVSPPEAVDLVRRRQQSLRFKPLLVAVTAAVLVVAVIGGVAWLLSGDVADTGPAVDSTLPPATTPATTSASATTFAASETPLQPEMGPGTWSEVPGRLAGITAFGSGFVAVGNSGEQPAVWRSADGASWDLVSVLDGRGPLHWGQMADVTTFGDGLVAVGTLPCLEYDCSVAVWASRDAVDWTLVYPTDESQVPTGVASMWDVAVFQDLLLAHVELQICGEVDPPCGTELWSSKDAKTWQPVNWSGGAPFYAPQPVAFGSGLVGVETPFEGAADTTARVWLSDDGRNWTPVQTSGLAAIGVGPITAGSEGLVASDNFGSVWFSEDGTSWSTIGGFPFGGGRVIDLHSLADGTILAVGSTCESAAVWMTSDGVNWTHAYSDGPGQMRAIADNGTTIVAVGRNAVTSESSSWVWSLEIESPLVGSTSMAGAC